MILPWFSGQNSLLSPSLPSSSASLAPVALHNCEKVIFHENALILGTEKWHHHLRPQLHNHSLSGGGERQSLPQSHCNRCAHSSIEERVRGSRLTTIGRVVQSKTWTRRPLCSVWEDWASELLGQRSHWMLQGICLDLFFCSSMYCHRMN